MKIRIICFMIISYISIVNAIDNSGSKIDSQVNAKDKTEKNHSNNVKIHGDTLIITNSSCNSKTHNSLISSLKTKDPNHTSSKQECEDEH